MSEDIKYLLLRHKSEHPEFKLQTAYFSCLESDQQVILKHEVAVDFAQTFSEYVEITEDDEWCKATLAEGVVVVNEVFNTPKLVEEKVEVVAVVVKETVKENKGGRPKAQDLIK